MVGECGQVAVAQDMCAEVVCIYTLITSNHREIDPIIQRMQMRGNYYPTESNSCLSHGSKIAR